MSSLSPKLREELRREGRENLYFFAKGILGFDWLDPGIHLPLCRILQDQKNTRVKVVLPRGWLKTTVCSCAYPLWRAVRDPNVRVLLVQNTFTNACAKLGRIKAVVERNALFRALFPEVLPDSSCTWKQESLCLKRPRGYDESTFEAAGTRTQVTSRHYNVIIEDDTVAPEREDLSEESIAPGEDDIEKAIGWHKLALPLLETPMSDQRIVVGTRWAERDLLGWIDEEEKGEYLSYERAALEDEQGRPSYDGESPYPRRFPTRIVHQIRASLGEYLFSALYMNSPMSGSDMVFKPSWIRYYDQEPRDLAVYTTVDLAGDPGSSSGKCANAIVTTGKHLVTGRIYVLDVWRKRANPGEVIQELFSHVRRWHPIRVGIESVGYQSTMLYWVRERMQKEKLWFSVEGILHGRTSKDARALGLQPLVENGVLLFRPCQTEAVQEFVSYPYGAYRDIIDTLSMQLKMWQMTVSVEERKEKGSREDPFSLDNAIRELKERVHKKGFPGDVMVPRVEEVIV